MTILADALRSPPSEHLSTDARNLHDRIVSEIEMAVNRGQHFGITETKVQQMIMSSYNVHGVPRAFSFGDDVSMREWQVTVMFRDGQTVVLTHHG